jgi:hypothetical protein
MTAAPRRRARQSGAALAALGLLLPAVRLAAQDTTTAAHAPTPTIQWLGVRGGLTVMGELYGRGGIGQPNRPSRTGRIAANMTFSLANGLVTVPLTALISTDQVSFRQQINQFGVSPTYQGMTVHLGHFSPQYSTFTLADQTLLGGGFEVDRDGFRAGVVGGRARRAAAPDTAYGALTGQPQFARHMWALRAGYGDPAGRGSVDVIYLAGADEPGSLDTSLVQYTTVAPERNSVLGLKGEAWLAAKRVHLNLEAATSRHAHQPGLTNTPTTSGRAASAKLGYRAGAVTMGGTLEYVGPEFVTFGNAGLAPDHFDYGLTLGGQLAQGRVAFNAMGGWRKDNLANALTQTTKRAIYTLAGTLQPVPAFGVDVQLTNNVNNSRAAIDTVRNVTGQYSITPRFIWRTGSAQHALVLLASRQTSDNSTTGAFTLVNTRATTLVGTWIVTLPSTLGFTLTGTRTAVVVDTLPATVVSTIAPGVRHAFLRQQLQLSVQLQVLHTGGASTTSNEIYPLVDARYAVGPGRTLELRTSVRHHTLSSTGTPAQAFTERVLTVQYSAAWR